MSKCVSHGGTKIRPFYPGGYIVYDRRELPRLKPIGPWGWAAHQQRLDLMLTTATLLGYEKIDCYFDNEDGLFNPPLPGPWWFPAYDFLRQKNLTVTETLTIEPYDHRS